ncbi:DUF5749 family beta-barrel protein [[Eubacterium] cellulosolvens]
MLELASDKNVSPNLIFVNSFVSAAVTSNKVRQKAKVKLKKKSLKKKLIRRPKQKLKNRQPTAKQKGEDEVPDEVKWLQEDPHDQLLSRFVETPKGTRVGESIGIEKSRIILKNKLKFYSIPLKFVKEKDEKLILRRKVNWSRAEKLGEIWRKNALDIIPKTKPKPSKASKAK